MTYRIKLRTLKEHVLAYLPLSPQMQLENVRMLKSDCVTLANVECRLVQMSLS